MKMKPKKAGLRILGIGFLICTLITLWACGENPLLNDQIPVTGISIPSTRNLVVGDDFTLTVTYTPANTTQQGVTWKSSDSEVVTVSEGKVTAVGTGTATITATSTADSKITATCEVTVVTDSVPLTGISIPATHNLLVGGDFTLTVTYTPANTTQQGVTWITSDSEVAMVSNGKITAVGPGTATITATSTADSSITAACEVTVVTDPVPLTGIS
ncbi:MAG: Ig-like domain-containing protein, partial [Treponema sp.]|nr:Ig-like domain-containing protein [Treponema sp.]